MKDACGANNKKPMNILNLVLRLLRRTFFGLKHSAMTVKDNFFFFLLFTALLTPITDEIRLHQTLLKRYDKDLVKDLLPVKKKGGSVTVKIGVVLNQLVDVVTIILIPVILCQFLKQDDFY